MDNPESSISTNIKTQHDFALQLLTEAKVKSIICTVLERCKKECYSNHLMVPLDDYEQRTSYYTAIPKTVLWRIENEENTYRTTAKSFSTEQRIAILKYMKEYYMKTEKPTFSQIFATLKEVTKMTDFVAFRREMSVLGYEYKKIKQGSILVEDPIFLFERFHFLNKLRKFRSKGREICYIDARIINKALSFEKVSETNLPVKSLDTHIYLHAVSENGFINGLFCNVINEEDYNKWVFDILVPILNPDSVIIMGNKSIFAAPTSKPERYSSKMKMIKWLEENNIPCHPDMHRAELYELIIHSKIPKHYKIDAVLKAHGFDCLHLPHKLEELSLTELMWNYMKKQPFVTEPQYVIKNQIDCMVRNIDHSVWKSLAATLKSWEAEIFKHDMDIEVILNNYEFIIDQN